MRSRRTFSKNRLSGQHEPPPFHMKGIDEAGHIPPPQMLLAEQQKRVLETTRSPAVKQSSKVPAVGK